MAKPEKLQQNNDVKHAPHPGEEEPGVSGVGGPGFSFGGTILSSSETVYPSVIATRTVRKLLRLKGGDPREN